MRKIIHIDMDAFYASVEIRDNPLLRGKPVAIGRSASERGVIATASYEARKFGVHSAMSTAKALQLCPSLILVPADFSKYHEISASLYAIYSRYTDIIEPVALDECYLDVSHLDSAVETAKRIKKEIRDELHLTASAGVSINKLIAKIASDYNKPDGLCIVKPHQVDRFIARVPVKDINGVGKEMLKRIHKLGLGDSCADLQRISLIDMIGYFGAFGERLYYYVRGVDERPVITSREVKSIGTENTFLSDVDDKDEIRRVLFEQLSEVINRASDKNILWKTLTLKLKFSDFKQITRSKTLEQPIGDLDTNYQIVCKVLDTLVLEKSIRLCGITLSGFVPRSEEDRDFFNGKSVKTSES